MNPSKIKEIFELMNSLEIKHQAVASTHKRLREAIGRECEKMYFAIDAGDDEDLKNLYEGALYYLRHRYLRQSGIKDADKSPGSKPNACMSATRYDTQQWWKRIKDLKSHTTFLIVDNSLGRRFVSEDSELVSEIRGACRYKEKYVATVDLRPGCVVMEINAGVLS